MTNEDPLMGDEQVEESVAKYLEDNAELLEGIVPEHDLWPAIESRITARVIPMSVRSARIGGRSWGWVPMLIAASALVVASAAVTYVLTARSSLRGGGSAAVATTQPAPTTPAVAHGVSPVVADSAAPDTALREASRLANATPAESAPSHGSHSGSDIRAGSDIPDHEPAAVLASQQQYNTSDAVRKTYDSEIATLHDALEARRGQLNPATVAVIEQNLRVIDDAISQSEAALARDPNSALLNDQLDRTLAKKTGLLRAAALLPAA
ncbi:MAG: hypothetical protein ABI338_06385 [Gemmatimonadaceae bacterium]